MVPESGPLLHVERLAVQVIGGRHSGETGQGRSGRPTANNPRRAGSLFMRSGW